MSYFSIITVLILIDKLRHVRLIKIKYCAKMDINIHSNFICKAQDLGSNYVYSLSLVIWALYVMHTSWRLGVSSLGLKSESGMIFRVSLAHAC